MNISKNKIYVYNMSDELKGASQIIKEFFEKAGRTSKLPDGTSIYTPPRLWKTQAHLPKEGGGGGTSTRNQRYGKRASRNTRGFSDYEYSTAFETFNQKMLKDGQTRYYVPDPQKIYNYTTHKLENRSKYFKKNRLKKPNGKMFDRQVVYTTPSSKIYTYSNNFGEDSNAHQEMKKIFYEYRGQNLTIVARYTQPNAYPNMPVGRQDIQFNKSFVINVPNSTSKAQFKKWYEDKHIFRLFEYTSQENIFDETANIINQEYIGDENQGRMKIFVNNDFIDKKLFLQQFAQGLTHCILTPIKDYLVVLMGKNGLSGTTANQLKLIRFYNRIGEWSEKYPPGIGIPTSELPQLCEDCKLGIDIYLPTPMMNKNSWLSFRPSKHCRKTFKFINSRLNHLEIMVNLTAKTTILSRQEFDEKLKELGHCTNDEYISPNTVVKCEEKKTKVILPRKEVIDTLQKKITTFIEVSGEPILQVEPIKNEVKDYKQTKMPTFLDESIKVEELPSKVESIQPDISNYHIYNNMGIITANEKFSVEDSYSKTSNTFERENGLDLYKLDYLDERIKQLNDFIISSRVYNGTIDFISTTKYRSIKSKKEVLDELNEDICEIELKENKRLHRKHRKSERLRIHKLLDKDNVKTMDMSRAYTRCDSSPFFEGYLGKITDFRITDKIEGIGIYQITDIDYTGCKIQDYIIKLGCLFDLNTYCSPELKYYQSLGIKFKILCGCWGVGINNFKWEGIDTTDLGEYESPSRPQAKWSMYDKDENGLRHYCKWFGISSKPKLWSSWRYKTTDKRFVENWSAVEQDEDIRMSYYEDKGVYNVDINIPKKTSYHLGHICSFIYSYQRIMMINQLMEIPINDIIRVVVDGIYYKSPSNIKVNYPFIQELDTSKFKFGNYPGKTYRTDNVIPNTDEMPRQLDRPFHLGEIHTGPGGSGKTHNVLIDKGNVNVLYTAHSWKLCAAKQREFKQDFGIDIDVAPVAHLSLVSFMIPGDPFPKKANFYEDIQKKYSVIVIDEISTLSYEVQKVIEDRFKNHKKIWCGDIGNGVIYQCPPIYRKASKNVEAEPRVPFQILNTHNHIVHTTNLRANCNRLKKLLNWLRNMIEDPNFNNNDLILINNFIESSFNVIGKAYIENYTSDDMILSRTHAINEYYDEKYKHLEKYYIQTAHIEYKNDTIKHTYNGEIHLIKPDIPIKNYRIRHGYTIDCIQGETAYHKLIIDINNLNTIQHLYTAVSRAKYISQIIFVK